MHIFDLYKYRISLFAHKFINTETKIRLQKVIFIKNKYNHNTRASIHDKIFKQYYRTKSFGKQTISNKISVSWNNLPSSLTAIKFFIPFKKAIRKYILETPTLYNMYDNKEIDWKPIPRKKIIKTSKKSISKEKKTTIGKIISGKEPPYDQFNIVSTTKEKSTKN
eukprot:Lithocolla_globosa_v1_NODE_84_length_6699_cov_54.834938.p4 type:complete len:165 gc:universal NODE_84_length_6699_cov_54.834938:225-719(+)